MHPTNEMVEWDYTHAVVLSIRTDSHAEPHLTGIPRRADSRTRWLPVQVDFPDDYLPEFADLLGPGVYDLLPGGDGLRKYFPYADFSVETVRAGMLDRINDVQHHILSETDVFLIRKLETGEDLPESVATGRQAVRAKVQELKERVQAADPMELVEIDLAEIPTVPRPHHRHYSHPTASPPPGAPGQPGDRPSALPPGADEPAPLDPSLTEEPDPALEGAPAPWLSDEDE